MCVVGRLQVRTCKTIKQPCLARFKVNTGFNILLAISRNYCIFFSRYAHATGAGSSLLPLYLNYPFLHTSSTVKLCFSLCFVLASGLPAGCYFSLVPRWLNTSNPRLTLGERPPLKRVYITPLISLFIYTLPARRCP